MSTDPSQPERKPLKPRKGYGIASLLCGVAVWFAILAFFLLYWLASVLSFGLLITVSFGAIMAGAIMFSPFCAITGIVCGILGRNTYERSYAYIGLVLSALYALLGFSITAYALLVAYF